MENTLSLQPRKMNGRVAIIIFSACAVLLRIMGYFIALCSNVLSMASDVFEYIFTTAVDL